MNVGATVSADVAETLRETGWARFASSCHSVAGLASVALTLAKQLGTPVQGRSPHLVEALRPKATEEAPLASLSRKFGLDSFPFHSDTAHWTTPAKFLILSCVNPGERPAPTLLVREDAIPLSDQERALAKSAVFLVRNGRRSFYSSILGLDRGFVRYDPGCMEPQTPDALMALELFSQKRLGHFAQSIDWEPGDSIIVDNWRMLHARAAVDNGSLNRLLLRCLVS